MGVTLRQLEVFSVVADLLHFGRAARELHVSQPVVSQEVARLERALGTALFDRSTRTVTLTEAGGALLNDARAVLDAASVLELRAARLRRPGPPTVRIAATPSVTNVLLPGLIREAELTLPHMTIEELAVPTGSVEESLVDGRCDLGLGRFLTAPRGHRVEVLGHEELYIALSTNDPRASLGRALHLHELEDLPLLLWPREQHPVYHDHLVSVCRADGLDPMLLSGSSLLVGMRSYLIADGRAFGLLPLSTVAALGKGITQVSLARPATVPLAVSWLTDDPRPYIHELLDLLREVSRTTTSHPGEDPPVAGRGRPPKAADPVLRGVEDGLRTRARR
jgi:DNA-binding transcriptional LysR family regulator